MKAIRLAILAAFLAPAFAHAADAPKGDAARGEKVFNTIGCWECHGVGGNGGSIAGPRIAHTALSYDQFLHQLRQPAQEMAPFEAAVVVTAHRLELAMPKRTSLPSILVGSMPSAAKFVLPAASAQ